MKTASNGIVVIGYSDEETSTFSGKETAGYWCLIDGRRVFLGIREFPKVVKLRFGGEEPEGNGEPHDNFELRKSGS